VADLAGAYFTSGGDESWHALAACRDHPEVSWFPGRHDDWRIPARICAGCPVIGPCRDWSLAQEGLAGIWAGVTEAGRARLRRQQTRPARLKVPTTIMFVG
jgi:hypothetical protein